VLQRIFGRNRHQTSFQRRDLSLSRRNHWTCEYLPVPPINYAFILVQGSCRPQANSSANGTLQIGSLLKNLCTQAHGRGAQINKTCRHHPYESSQHLYVIKRFRRLGIRSQGKKVCWIRGLYTCWMENFGPDTADSGACHRGQEERRPFFILWTSGSPISG